MKHLAQCVVALALLAPSARAEMPELEMAGEVTCAHVARTIGDPAIVGRCMADEAASRERLAPHWDGLPTEIRQGCVAYTTDTGFGSFQILARCVEDELEAANLPSPLPPEVD